MEFVYSYCGRSHSRWFKTTHCDQNKFIISKQVANSAEFGTEIKSQHNHSTFLYFQHSDYRMLCITFYEEQCILTPSRLLFFSIPIMLKKESSVIEYINTYMHTAKHLLPLLFFSQHVQYRLLSARPLTA
jgi:hypothetical protein